MEDWLINYYEQTDPLKRQQMLLENAGVGAEELDPELAGKWRLLWKWWIGLLLGLFGCIFLALISAILGLLAILADAIGLLVVGIVKLVYLYRTAKRFREYQPAALQKEVL